MQLISLLFWFLFSVARAEEATVTIRHVEPDPKEEGVGIIVSVEDKHGTPVELCKDGSDCKDAFKVHIASGLAIDTDLHDALTFDEYEEEGYATLILIDRSGSMSPYWNSVKEAAKSYINGMNKKDEAAIYTFNNNVDYLGNTIRWEKDKSRLRTKVDNLSAPSGGTQLYKSLRNVLSLVKEKKTPKFRTIVVLTDAIDASAEGFGMYETIVRWSRDSKVPINVVGFTPETNVDEENLQRLKDLAVDTQGRFSRVKNDKQIAAEFQKIQDRVHKTWLLKVAVCDFPAGWHDYRVVAKKDGKVLGLNSSVFPINKDINGGVRCGHLNSSEKSEIDIAKPLTEEDWPYILLGLIGMGVIAIGVSSAQKKGQSSEIRKLRAEAEAIQSKLSNIERQSGSGGTTPLIPADMSTQLDPLRNQVSNLRVQVDAVQEQSNGIITQLMELRAGITGASRESKNTQDSTLHAKSSRKGTQIFSGAILQDTNSQQIYEIGRLKDGEIIRIGSDAGQVSIHIDIPTISGHHANIYCVEGQYYLEDNRSTNGSFVDNRPVRGPEKLSDNVLVRLGNHTFRFSMNF